jgi:hypothetical protein
MNIGPRLFRLLINLYPPYLFSRTLVKYIAPDWREVRVVLKKSLLTRNYVGTIFGGSLYQAADPFFMIMLIKILGIKDYIIWDQSAEIFFVKPAKSKVSFHFKISDQDLKAIHQGLADKGISRPKFLVEGRDRHGDICVQVKKMLYIRKKDKSKGPSHLFD